ncbi:ABC transporter permease [Streptomyces camponoticapitis]|uniref:ABC transporter permease n=1 Tax=Streptomyces camponoticapitis TaxID=1616125 RepID=A0ABQ2E2P0_9ACTN|nr:ABC transporter permease [Streptomyces camponoticapitis]GGJ88880.1 ABC transporter permease [Streptomyces camponoticapitis]
MSTAAQADANAGSDAESDAGGGEGTDTAVRDKGAPAPGGGPSPDPGTLSARRAVGLVAKREINSRMRTKSFVLSTLGLVLALGVYTLIILFSKEGPTKVGLDRDAAAMRPMLTAVADRASDLDFEFVTVDGDRAETLLRDGDVSAVISGGTADLTVTVERETNDELLAVVNAAVAEDSTTRELERAGVDPAEFAERVASSGAETRTLEPSENSAAEQFALILSSTGLLYFFFIVYGIMLAQGVVEEKTSRVVELLLSSIRPWQLLAGKLIGVAVVGVTQLVLLGGAAVVLAEGTGAISLPTAVGGTLMTMGVWFLLGFFLFAAMLAAAAARVSRQEDLQAVVQPVMVLITTPFVLGITLLSKNAHDPVIEWLSLVPPLSPILMPARMLLGIAPAWQVAVSLVLAVAALVGLTRVAGRMYANSVLRSGSRVPLADSLRLR